MRNVYISPSLRTILFLFILGIPQRAVSADSVHLAPVSNHGQHKNQPYVTAGDRTYLIGTQDGNFPDMGDHVPGEMGGLWMPPIKLIDGFWGTLKDLSSGQEVTLSDAAEFITYPFGSRFRYPPVLDGLEVERFQFCPDGYPGIVIQYHFQNTTNRAKRMQFSFVVKTDLLPVWFSEHLGIHDGEDTAAWNETKKLFTAWDKDNKWLVVWGALDSVGAHPLPNPAIPQPTKGKGIARAEEFSLTIDGKRSTSLTFIIAGSTKDANEAVNTYEFLGKQYSALLASKKEHFSSILARARIEIPDDSLMQVYNWTKVNTEWMIRDVPGLITDSSVHASGKTERQSSPQARDGRGLSGAFMEYPWWFGTETYSLQAAMATGDFELVKQTLRLLDYFSMKTNGNGRIVHEVTTYGAVSNPGNTQETPQFIMCVGRLFEWTGDINFIKEMYPTVKMGIHWLLHDMDQNKDLFPEGYGIMEVYGLNAELIDVSVYTQQALEAAARMAKVLHHPDEEKNYRALAAQLKTKINEKFWDETEQSYCDFYGTTSQAIQAADGAITQIKLRGEHQLRASDSTAIAYYERLKQKFLAMPDTSRGWLTNKNWVITTPMETGIAPRDKALPLLDKIRKEDSGPYGPYLSAVEKQAMMTISTGVQAVSECNYGRTDKAMDYVKMIVRTFGVRTPGCISEMMPNWGCFTIAWTSYGIVLPLVEHVFGIHPDAFDKKIIIEPHLPTGWENIRLTNLPVGTDSISFSREKTQKGIEFKLTAKTGGWKFIVKLANIPGAKYFVNDRSVSFSSDGFVLGGKENHILVAQ